MPEEWAVVKTNKLFSLEYGAGLPDRERSGEGYPVYGSNGIVGYHKECLINDIGIVVGRKGTIGSVTLTRNSFWPIDTTYYIKLKQESNIIWAYYLLLKLKLKRLDSSTGVPGLNRNDVYELKVPLPPLQEQRRIAEILTAADQRIEKEEAYRDKLLQLKKGLMQDLLTGKVRVKDGSFQMAGQSEN